MNNSKSLFSMKLMIKTTITILFSFSNIILLGQGYKDRDNEIHHPTEHKEVTLIFSMGSDKLSDENKTYIKSMIEHIDVPQENLKVMLAGWGDRPFLLDKKNHAVKPSSMDERLANKRLDIVSDFIKSNAKFFSIEKFNMEKKSSLVSRILGTDDADLKKEMVDRLTNDNEMEILAAILKEKGKSSSVVIVVAAK